jgi:hypothetical protein
MEIENETSMAMTPVEATLKNEPAKRRGPGAPKGNTNGLVHGLTRYRRLLSGKTIDRRTSLHKVLAEMEAELVAAVGGDPSPQEKMLINTIVKTQLYLSTCDRHLMGLKHLVRKGRPVPLLAERSRLASVLVTYLDKLGLQRRAKPALNLAEMLQQQQNGGK